MSEHRPGTAAAVRKILLGVIVCSFVGCQEQSMVSNLPPPNFNGPLLAHPTPQPLPVQRTAPPVAANPAPARTGPREWTPAAPARNWQWIVIHHSATPAGNAAQFDKMHREKGWDELGYHFVIGNGTDSGDGQVEVGPRWGKQKWGAHAKTPDNRYNDYGIGICLVGNFDSERPTPRQLQSLARLTAHLMKVYHIGPDRVLGHSDTGRATDCPGTHMNVAQVRQMAARLAALDEDADSAPRATAAAASVEELLSEEHPAAH